ncbi:MAG: hypothetical protein Q9225_007950, partial [Loekoesia sp. 1 TL-2023]
TTNTADGGKQRETEQHTNTNLPSDTNLPASTNLPTNTNLPRGQPQPIVDDTSPSTNPDNPTQTPPAGQSIESKLDQRVSQTPLRLGAAANENHLRETVRGILRLPLVRAGIESSKPRLQTLGSLVSLIDSLFAPKVYLDLKKTMAQIIRRQGYSAILWDQEGRIQEDYSIAGKSLRRGSPPPNALVSLQNQFQRARQIQALREEEWAKTRWVITAMHCHFYWEEMKALLDEAATPPNVPTPDHQYILARGAAIQRGQSIHSIGSSLLEAAIPVLLHRHPSLTLISHILTKSYIEPLHWNGRLDGHLLRNFLHVATDPTALINACQQNGLAYLFGFDIPDMDSTPQTPTTNPPHAENQPQTPTNQPGPSHLPTPPTTLTPCPRYEPQPRYPYNQDPPTPSPAYGSHTPLANTDTNNDTSDDDTVSDTSIIPSYDEAPPPSPPTAAPRRIPLVRPYTSARGASPSASDGSGSGRRVRRRTGE